MPVRLSTTSRDFETELAALLGAKRESAPEVDEAAAAIIADVQARGDAAVMELTAKFDRQQLTPDTIRVTEAELDAAVAETPVAELEALELAAARIDAAGKAPGILATTAEDALRYRDWGYRFVAGGVDTSLLTGAAAQLLDRLRDRGPG